MGGLDSQNRDQGQHDIYTDQTQEEPRNPQILAARTYRAQNGDHQQQALIGEEYRRRTPAAAQGRDENESNDAYRDGQL